MTIDSPDISQQAGRDKMQIYSPGDRIVYYGHNPHWCGLLGTVVAQDNLTSVMVRLDEVEGDIGLLVEDITPAVWTGGMDDGQCKQDEVRVG